MQLFVVSFHRGAEMPFDFSLQVLSPAYGIFARPVTFTPTVSQPGQPAYDGRGIYETQPIDVLTEDSVIFSDTRTILDVMEREFTKVPEQGDTLYIGPLETLLAIGSFEVIEVKSNGGGETTLSLRRIMETKP